MKKIVCLLMLCVAGLFAQEQPKGLVLHWPLNEGQGVQIKDALGKHNGTIANAGVTKWVEGRDGGKALAFLGGVNGQAPFVSTEYANRKEFCNGMTVSLWVKLDPEKYIRNTIWSFCGSGRNGTGFYLVIHYQRLLLGGDGNRLTKFAASNNGKNPILGGVWTHFAATHDGKSTFKVYIDGALAGQTTEANGGPVTESNGALFLGSMYGYGTPCYTLSDFRLYNRPLSDVEIQNLALGE